MSRTVAVLEYLVAIFFFGIEELAVQLEEPFSILPLSMLCDSVWDGGFELYDEPEPSENTALVKDRQSAGDLVS